MQRRELTDVTRDGSTSRHCTDATLSLSRYTRFKVVITETSVTSLGHLFMRERDLKCRPREAKVSQETYK
jgi:hypothetical protein